MPLNDETPEHENGDEDDDDDNKHDEEGRCGLRALIPAAALIIFEAAVFAVLACSLALQNTQRVLVKWLQHIMGDV